MKPFINKLVKRYLQMRHEKIEDFSQNPEQYQRTLLRQLLRKAEHTGYGKKYDFRKIKNDTDFQTQVPLVDYNTLKPWIHRMMMGERDVLWPGQVRFFSKSSGTSEDKSKYLPVSRANLYGCHIKGTWDTMAAFYHNVPRSRLFEKKSILLGGTYEPFEENPHSIIGDISALMMMNMPPIGKPFAALDGETFFMKDWGEKINRIAEIGLKNRDTVMMCGVPTWSIAILKRMLELSGKDNISEIWPEFQGFIHGGVNFSPYKETFKQFFPSPTVNYQEIYNSTEGFFAMQDDFTDSGMLLLLDNGIFFEFLPMSELHADQPRIVPLWEVEKNVDYAIVISTNAGLWRFIVGDTVMFTSLAPYRIKITGRTKLFINAFGEEVVIENAENAIARTCKEFNVEIHDYTAAPFYLNTNNKGKHEWLIEFKNAPENLSAFEKKLDINLQALNSDYETKRVDDLALENLIVHAVPPGTFNNWLAQKGKLGGQNKVPRLSNNRKIVEEIIGML